MRLAFVAALVLCLATACAPTPAGTGAPAFPRHLRALGTEPFWSLVIDGGEISYSTAERPQAVTSRVARSEVNGALRLEGRLAGEPIDVSVVREACSDGMSDRSYPYAVRVRLGDGELNGCALLPRGLSGNK